MLRRCIRELSPSARSLGRRRQLPAAAAAQTPFFLSSRNELSTASPKQPPKVPGAQPEGGSGTGGAFKKVVVGGIVVGAAVLAAYQSGYIDNLVKDEQTLGNRNREEAVSSLKHTDRIDASANLPTIGTLNESKPNAEDAAKAEDGSHVKEIVPEVKTDGGDALPARENESRDLVEEIKSALEEQTASSEIPSEGNVNREERVDGSTISSDGNVNVDGDDVRFNIQLNDQPEKYGAESHTNNSEQMARGSDAKEAAPHQEAVVEVPTVSSDRVMEAPKPLAESYALHADELSSGERKKTDALAGFFNEKEALVAESGKSVDEKNPGDPKIVLDFIEAIHAAEKRQAETDAYIFSEEKRKLKEKYEKELRDARARELMYAEEAAILDKELNKEKVKAASAIKSLQEKAVQKLHEELLRKEEEAEMELKKAQELAKAELAAAIAREKASQIEKIAEADMEINALCKAFYARSEEARQTHSVHKLAVGTLALEDALSKGLPIRAEVNALQKSLEGIDGDSLLNLVLTSLPEEVLNYGIDTDMQLNQKFDSLKGTLRHFSLIPAGGGGLLTHTVAHIASSIKMREDQSGEGIESVISKVENYLIQGRFAEAAETLEGGVHGSEAKEVVSDWIRHARNRAIVEQALSVLQSYASSVTFS